MSYREIEDRRKYGRQHYLNNKDLYKQRALASKKRTRAENGRRVVEYLLAHPCVDCGESDPVVLQFDHLGEKAADVARMVSNGVSWTRIMQEIAKCEVVCANCHFRRTARRHGSWIKALQGGVV